MFCTFGTYSNNIILKLFSGSQLYSLSSVYKSVMTIKVDDEEVEQKLKNQVVSQNLASPVPDSSASDNSLNKVMGIVNISAPHFICYVASFKDILVQTLDPYF